MSDDERVALLDDEFRPALAALGGTVYGVLPLRRAVGVPRDGSSIRYEARGPSGVRFVARFYLDPDVEPSSGFSYDLRSVHGPLESRRWPVVRPGEVARVLAEWDGRLVPEDPDALPATTATVARAEAAVTTLGLARGASTYYEVLDAVRPIDPDGRLPRLPDAVTAGYRSSERDVLTVAVFLEGLVAGAPHAWAARHAVGRGGDS